MSEYIELVSVIVPVYNVEKFLDKCVESILLQTYRYLEIILIDDGSTDFSGHICDKWLKCDDRVKVIHKKNGGLSDARNAGLNIANGDYYAFIDSDDYISTNMIETMMDAIKNNSCDIAICNMTRFSDNGNSAPFYNPVGTETVLNGMDRFKTLIQPSVCNKIFNAKLFEGIRFPKGKYYEDTFVYHQLLYHANSVVLTGLNSYWYLLREGSIVGQPQYTDRYFDFIEAVWCRMVFLLEHNIQPYADEACLSLYVAIANAEKNIKKSSKNKEYFKKAYSQYELAYDVLIRRGRKLGIKQCIRLIILRYFPVLHTKIY